MSLNEIVNNPKAYQSSSPYLVVQHVDWIQCRYLFVKSSQTDAGNPYQLANLPGQPGNSATLAGSTDLNLVAAPAAQKTEYAAQDPRWGCKSTLRRVIRIPLSTLSAAKTFRNVSKENSKGKGKEKLPPKAKRAKLEPSDLGTPQGYTTDSDESDIEDVAFLISDVEIEDGEKSHMNKPAGSSQTKIQGNSKFTDFVPGTLKQASLPLLQPPSYATPTATMSLNRELQKILKIQKSTPLHELGWYIDQDLIGNLYQWIVELHSFDGELPVAKDMKAAGVTSIVLEIRFGKDFPHSPPFVRVIRPRFLPFTQGGGGHVTLGGAMCMELLTNSGWSAVNSIESVLLQVRLAIMNLEPQPARLEKTSMTSTRRDYGTGEAIEAYIRACRTHGWEVPKDFHNFGNASLLN
ncbi:polymerase [Phlyctema vagabunda]|uniref:Polymerase n=1 Tax=Phlyctema vagabunda TaxID=108571 RepID=A0ABR4PY71_9HELO